MIKANIIFTDLDGTLLDENYSSEDALPVLNILKKKKIPIILCSAKTRTEQEVIRNKLGTIHPFIVENGSAIYLPKGYFEKRSGDIVNGYEVIVLGERSEKVTKEIEGLREKYVIKSYYNMTDDEVAKVTGLSLEDAKHAKNREFGETVVKADKNALVELEKKFNVVPGGRFIQVFGKGADKGRAVKILSDLYRRQGDVTTVGIGNSYNDEPMLRAVDLPAIVRNPDGNLADLKIEKIYKADEIGPKGWVEVVRKFILGEQDE